MIRSPEPVAGSIVRAGNNKRAEYRAMIISMAANYAREATPSAERNIEFGGNLASSGIRSREALEDSVLLSTSKKSFRLAESSASACPANVSKPRATVGQKRTPSTRRVTATPTYSVDEYSRNVSNPVYLHTRRRASPARRLKLDRAVRTKQSTPIRIDEHAKTDESTATRSGWRVVSRIVSFFAAPGNGQRSS